MNVIIQKKSINISTELRKFSIKNKSSGSIVNFVGKVREKSKKQLVKHMFVECYEEMAKKQINLITKKALLKWKLDDYKVVHRHGKLKVGETIVIVMTSSQHRKDSFEATSYIMDWLKIRAPFWKKEIYNNSEKWVTQNQEDLINDKF